MALRGHGWGIAALALLAACGSEPPPKPRTDTGPSDVPALAAPVAPIAPPPTASPSATPAPDATGPPALPTAYIPRDECAKLPGFAAFRDKVFAAAKAKDADTLVALADPKINLDFGGGSGPEELTKRLADPDAALWAEIAALSGLGCAADGGVVTLPWIFSRIPDGFGDGGRAMYGLGPRLSLRAKPAPSARLLATLTWPVVELEGAGFDPKAAYAQVRLSDGTAGYLETARLRSLLDYRLIADRQDGAWKITALIAGD